MSTGGLTAPYLETWRTNKEASLNSGRGTILHERAGGGGHYSRPGARNGFEGPDRPLRKLTRHRGNRDTKQCNALGIQTADSRE